MIRRYVTEKHKNPQGSKRKMVDWLIGKNNKRMTSSTDFHTGIIWAYKVQNSNIRNS